MAEVENDILIKFLNTSTDILASASDGSIDMQVNGIFLSSNEVIMKYMIHDSDFVNRSAKHVVLNQDVSVSDDIVMCFSDFYSSDIETRIICRRRHC